MVPKSVPMPSKGRPDRFELSRDAAHEYCERCQTPLYVIDENSLRASITSFKEAAVAAWPGAITAFAAKANSTLAVLKIASDEGCWIDVASYGEMQAAIRAGAEPDTLILHGNAKSPREINAAITKGIGAVVIDNFTEIERIAECIADHEKGTKGKEAIGKEANGEGTVSAVRYWLRLSPGVSPDTHEKISTGQDDTKFGFNIRSGAAMEALRMCQSLGIPISGVHAHVGSQLMTGETQAASAKALATLLVENLQQFTPDEEGLYTIDVGGGLGIRYLDSHNPEPLDTYHGRIADALKSALPEDLTGRVRVIHEPGRALVGEAGVTLYTVQAVKEAPLGEGNFRKYVSVDGGLADNPRPAMYGSPYTVISLCAKPDTPIETVTICGRHCETDTLLQDIQLPVPKVGDLLQVLCTGAYNSSMASNYNRYPRPNTVLIRPDGRTEIIQKADTYDEMFMRESIPTDL